MTVDVTTAPAPAPWRNRPRLLTAALVATAAGPVAMAALFFVRMVAEGTNRAAMGTGAYDPKEMFPGPTALVWGALVLLYLFAPFVTPILVVGSALTLATGRRRMSRAAWYALLATTIAAPVVVAAVLADGNIGRWMAD